MERGLGKPTPEAIARLHQEAFARFGTSTLWSRRPSEHPTIAQAIVVAQGLRQEGGMKALPLAA